MLNFRLIKMFDERNESLSKRIQQARSTLISYSSLMLNAGCKGNHITETVPTTAGLAAQILQLVLRPSFLLWLPAAIVHIPSYIFASHGKKFLMKEGEEEAAAQLQGVMGGVGLGLSYAALGSMAFSILLRIGSGAGVGMQFIDDFASSVAHAGRWKCIAWRVATMYVSGKLVNAWHNALVTGEWCK